MLGENEASSLSKQTLNEEKETDEKLTRLSRTINSQALRSGVSVNDSEQSKLSIRPPRPGALIAKSSVDQEREDCPIRKGGI